jgi:NADH-quinone oxidoreductase subunit M
MGQLHLPWLGIAILAPLAGAAFVVRIRDWQRAQRRTVIFSGVALACTIGAWIDFTWLDQAQAHDHWPLVGDLFGASPLAIDEFSAPLLPMGALVYLVTMLSAVRSKARRFSFAWTMVSESILLALFSCRSPWGVIALLALSNIPPLWELHARRKPLRVFAIHMAAFVAMLSLGWIGVEQALPGDPPTWAIVSLTLAILLRCRIAPLHVWLTDLFDHASFSTSLVFVAPMAGPYGAVRLLLPIAPDWALRAVAVVSLFTAVYAAGMALVQRDARRFFCYLFLSNSALVLAGFEIATPLGLTAALSLWISVCLSLTGFGLVLRAVEARTGRVLLSEYHGLYEHTPMLAAFFLLTGLASIGFPGTIGFVGGELLVESAVDAYPYVGLAVVLVAALNGIAVMRAFFRVFTGKRYYPSISLQCRPPERVAVLALAVLILAGGLVPQPGVESRHRAAAAILEDRIQRTELMSQSAQRPPNGRALSL